jgi:hypothetical protein
VREAGSSSIDWPGDRVDAHPPCDPGIVPVEQREAEALDALPEHLAVRRLARGDERERAPSVELAHGALERGPLIIVSLGPLTNLVPGTPPRRLGETYRAYEGRVRRWA